MLAVIPIQAQTPEVQRATLYREGVDAASAGHWSDARDRFAAALAIRNSAKVRFSLAQSEEQLGLVASAQRDYVRALELAKAAKEDDVVSAAEKAITLVAPRVPHLRVVLSGARSTAGDAAVTLDDQPIALGATVSVDPGPHSVTVTAPGAAPSTTSVAIGEQQQLDVPVALDVVEGPPGRPAAIQPVPARGASLTEAPTTHASDGNGTWRAVGLGTAGAGLVAMGVGAYFGLDAKSKDDASNDGCSGNACSPGAAATRRAALASATDSNVAFAVGGVLAATGVALWWLSRGSGSVDARVAPAVGPSGAAIVTQGTWW